VRTQIEENMATSIVINTVFAGFIAFGVAYNAARLTFAERARELASLRVLGFTRREVGAILAAELAVLTLLAIPLGWVLGMAISWTIATGLTTELFRIPFVARPATYGWTSLMIVAAAAVSGALVVRRVSRLDLVEVLKTRG
jgi:putative ABC transport system permease protein